MNFLDDVQVRVRLEHSVLRCLLKGVPAQVPGAEALLREEARRVAREALGRLSGGIFEHRWRPEPMPELAGEERRIGAESAGSPVFIRVHAEPGLTAELRQALERRAPARALLVCREDAYAPLCFFESQVRLIPVLPRLEDLLSSSYARQVA
jgi:hypothetical protein